MKEIILNSITMKIYKRKVYNIPLYIFLCSLFVHIGIQNNKSIIKSVNFLRFKPYASLNIDYLDEKENNHSVSTKTFFWKGNKYIGRNVKFIITKTNKVIVIDFS